MATPNHQTEAENAAHPPVAPVDPFAVDFFGGAALPADVDEPIAGKNLRIRRRPPAAKKSDWHKNLPRITNAEAEFSNLLSNLPDNLTASAARIAGETIAAFAAGQIESRGFEAVSVREVDLNRAIARAKEAPKVFLSIGSRHENASALVAVSLDFASAVIDAMLDDQGKPPVSRRELSPVETTILEFLAGNVLRALNDYAGDSILYLEGARTPPGDFFAPFERGAEVVFGVRGGELNGDFSVFAPARFLRSLDRSRNPLFTGRNERNKIGDYEKFARELSMSLQIGKTFLDADSLVYLEPEDIVLIEQPQIYPGADEFGRNLQLLVGSGSNFRFRGHADSRAPGGKLNFRIEEILSEESRRRFMPAKFQMDEQENELAEETAFEQDAPAAGIGEDEELDERISPALENIQVGLRVEIAGSKVSLRDLQNLRAGQIIALGCSPTDPVRLVADSSQEPVATGELVEIEGQLGVRLTKVFI